MSHAVAIGPFHKTQAMLAAVGIAGFLSGAVLTKFDLKHLQCMERLAVVLSSWHLLWV